MPHRLVYLGTPAMSVAPLVGLHEAGFEIALVVTGADRRRGRGSSTSPSPVKAAALDLGLAVSHVVDDVIESGADLGVVVAFGQMIGQRALDGFDFVNLHYSLLPRWRGAAPIERAILAGDTETGVCLMQLEASLDTGPVFRREVVPITDADSAADLADKLTAVAVPLLIGALTDGLATPAPQQGEPTYAHKIDQSDLTLHWHESAEHLQRVVRVGGAHTQFRSKRLKVWAASVVFGHGGEPGAIEGDIVACGDHGLRLLAVQPEGKPRMSAADWLNGAQPGTDERLVSA